MGAAFGHLHSKSGFHLFETSGQGGLRDIADLGCARVIRCICEGNKKRHLAKCRHGDLWLSRKQITTVV
jgi:hypothetical protein